MKIFIYKSIIILFVLNFGFEVETQKEKITVLVLPPYDEIANAGISPNVREMLENTLQDETLAITKFPFKKLMGISYHNVFDKKYCKPILEKVKTDVIIMSKIDETAGNGNMEEHKWNLSIRIYNTKTNKQINSKLDCQNCNNEAIQNFLTQNKQKLVNEIRNTR